jgi:hypothetical protein
MPPRRSANVLCLALVAAGCGSDRLFVPLPAGAEGAAGWLLVVERPGTLEILGFDRPPLVVQDPAGAGQDLRLELLAYEQALSSLGLAAGAIPPDPSGGPPPSPWRTFEVSVSGGDADRWTALDQPSPSVAALRIRSAATPCDRLRVEAWPFDGSSRGAVAISSTVGLALRASEAFLFSAGGVERPLRTEPPVVFAGLLRRQNGELFTSLEGSGEIVRARITGDRLVLEQVATSTVPHGLRWMAGGGEEIFGLTREGHLMMLDAGRSVSLARFADNNGFTAGGLVWLGPGQVVAAHRESSAAYFWRQGQLLPRSAPLGVIGLSAAAQIEGYGLLFGTTSGSVLRYDQEFRFVADFVQTHSKPFRVLARWDQRLLAAGSEGVVALIEPGGGGCVTRLWEHQASFSDAVILEGRAVLFTEISRIELELPR